MPRVYLAVGHGVKPDGTYDPGAVSTDGRWSEQKAGGFVVDQAAKDLRALGVDVKDEAFKDDPNFVGSARTANDWGADYVVPIHHDWSLAPDGAFVHWYTAAGGALADDIYHAIGAAGFLLRPSWHKRRTDLYILKNTNAPSALVECGRIGAAPLDTEAELRNMGHAIAAGIAKHIGLKQTPPPLEDEMADPEVLAVLQSMAADLKEIRAKLHTHVYQSEARGVIANALLNGDDETALKEALRVAPTATGYRPIG